MFKVNLAKEDDALMTRSLRSSNQYRHDLSSHIVMKRHGQKANKNMLDDDTLMQQMKTVAKQCGCFTWDDQKMFL